MARTKIRSTIFIARQPCKSERQTITLLTDSHYYRVRSNLQCICNGHGLPT